MSGRRTAWAPAVGVLLVLAGFGMMAPASVGQSTYHHPRGWYEFPIPDNWSFFPGPDDWAIFQDPNGSGVFIVSFEYWSVYGPNETAIVILNRTLPSFLSGGSVVVDAPSGRTIDGHDAAESFYRSSGPAPYRFGKVAVVVAPEWEYAWILQGSGTADQVAVVNATIDAFRILPAPPLAWFSNPAKHFRIRIPPGWSEGNPTIGGVRVDALLTHQTDANFVVTTEARVTNQTATSVLQATIDGIGGSTTVQVLQAPRARVINGHAAAQALIELNPGTTDAVRQVLAVVLGPEFPLIWFLAGSARSIVAGRLLPMANATIASFQVIPGSEAGLAWLLLGLAGIGVAVLVVLVLWRRRRARATPGPTRNVDTAQPPPPQPPTGPR